MPKGDFSAMASPALSKLHASKLHAMERRALGLLQRLTTVRGTPGIHRNRAGSSAILFTYREGRGAVVGALVYYLHGFISPVRGERFAGWCELVVAESHQRQGIAMQLLSRASGEVDLKVFEQAYSPEGYLLMCKFLGLPQPSIDALRSEAAKTKFGTLSLRPFPVSTGAEDSLEAAAKDAARLRNVLT